MMVSSPFGTENGGLDAEEVNKEPDFHQEGVAMALVRFGLVFAIISSCACSTVSVTKMTGVDPAPPRPANCEMPIFGSEEDVDRPFEILCLVDSKTGQTLYHRRSVAAAVDHLLPKACECGGDALIVLDTHKKGMGWTYGHGRAKAKVIRFLDDE